MNQYWQAELRFAHLIEPPFCYRSADNEATGCDVEVARHVLQALGVGSFVPLETEFADLLRGLVDERWDMTTGLFVTAERRKQVDFSRPIWALSDGMLVKAGNPYDVSGYGTISDSESLTLGVITDQVQHDTALRLGVPAERIRCFETYAEAAEAVLAGAVDAYASVARAHRGYLAQSPALRLAVVDVPVSEAPPAFGAFAFAKSSGELRRAVDDQLAAYLGSPQHRTLMTRFGFSETDLNLIPRPGS